MLRQQIFLGPYSSWWLGTVSAILGKVCAWRSQGSPGENNTFGQLKQKSTFQGVSNCFDAVHPHSGEQGYGELGEEGEHGEEEEGDGAQVVPGDYGSEGAHHQNSVNASFEATTSVFGHLEKDADDEYREEAKAGEGNENEEKFDETSKTDQLWDPWEAPHHHYFYSSQVKWSSLWFKTFNVWQMQI